MSVILKALRVQSEEARGGQPPQLSGPRDSFHVDKSSSNTPGDGPGSRRRQIVLLIILLLSLVAFAVIQYWDKGRARPAPTPVPPPRPVEVKPEPSPVPATFTEAKPLIIPVAPKAATGNDLQIARSQFKAGEYDESLKSFQRALESDPGNATIHNDMGLVLLKKELYASAEGHFAKALELNDACAECYNNLGYLKTALDQPVEAEKYLQKAIALKPDYPDPYFNLAVAYEKNGDIGRAVDFYQKYLKMLPKSETELADKIKSRIHDLSGD